LPLGPRSGFLGHRELGFDGVALGEISVSELTTVSLDLGNLSRQAFRLFAAIIEGSPADAVPVAPRLLERASTGSPVEFTDSV